MERESADGERGRERQRASGERESEVSSSDLAAFQTSPRSPWRCLVWKADHFVFLGDQSGRAAARLGLLTLIRPRAPTARPQTVRL